MSSKNKDNFYDIIIAGAGLAGILSLTRLRQIHPKAKILLLEKEEHIGGRLRIEDGKENPGAGGLHYVSKDLYDFMQKTLLACSQSPEEEFHFELPLVDRLQIIQGKKSDVISLTDMGTSKFAKIIGGNNGSKQWDKFLETIEKTEDAEKFQALNKLLNLKKKDPFWDLLNVVLLPLGIISSSFSTLRSVEDRITYTMKGMYGGPWSELLESLVHWAKPDLMLKKPILDSKYKDGIWTLYSDNLEVQGKVLVVAQPPWDAFPWLKRENSPAGLVTTALKFSPLSVVSLISHFETEHGLECPTLVPSEKSHIYPLSPKVLCSQTIINFETFLNAPKVVQAVKQTKRAKNKMCKSLGIEPPQDHQFLSLRSTGWTQDASIDSRKQVEDFDGAKLNKKYLVFCGDAYGNTYDPDQNIIKSVLGACSVAVI